MNTYIYTDFEPYYVHVNAIINKLNNWEILSDQEIEMAIKTMKLIVDTRICNILVEQPKYIDSLIKLIDSENYPLAI